LICALRSASQAVLRQVPAGTWPGRTFTQNSHAFSPNSPVFRAAQLACKKLMPGLP
jgi:hypothetical protein